MDDKEEYWIYQSGYEWDGYEKWIVRFTQPTECTTRKYIHLIRKDSYDELLLKYNKTINELNEIRSLIQCFVNDVNHVHTDINKGEI